MKSAAQTTGPVFSTSRMVQEYAGLFYFPAYERFTRLAAEELARSKELVAWQRRLREAWPNVRVEQVETNVETEIGVGDNLEIRAVVQLGGIEPTDLRVEAIYGPLDSHGNFTRSKVLFLSPHGEPQDGKVTFSGTVQFRTSGRQGVAIRVTANHEDILCPWDTALVTWAG
jgi:starch phosphorylase